MIQLIKLNQQGLSEAKVDKIKEVVNKLCGASLFKTANDVAEARKQIFRISTGSDAFEYVLVTHCVTYYSTLVYKYNWMEHPPL